MAQDQEPVKAGGVIQIDERPIRDHVDRVVRATVESSRPSTGARSAPTTRRRESCGRSAGGPAWWVRFPTAARP